MIYQNAFVLDDDCTFRQMDVRTENGRIVQKGQSLGAGTDLTGRYLFPGLVDIHTHGCLGRDFTWASCEDYAVMTSYYAQNGITSILPTTITVPFDALLSGLARLASYTPPAGHAKFAGINSESIFLSAEKRGAHGLSLLRPPDLALIEQMQKAAQGKIRMVCIAPELPGAEAVIRALAEQGIVVSIAHSDATCAFAKEALSWGADHFTHLYNAMRGFSHREPGVVGAALDSRDTYPELISDGVHVDPAAVRMAFGLRGDHICLISDSVTACGLPDGVYGDLIVKDRKALNAEGAIAGSATNLYECMKKAISFGIRPEQAIAAATIQPARSVRLDGEIGSITVGKAADMVVADSNWNIQHVIIDGTER